MLVCQMDQELLSARHMVGAPGSSQEQDSCLLMGNMPHAELALPL